MFFKKIVNPIIVENSLGIHFVFCGYKMNVKLSRSILSCMRLMSSECFHAMINFRKAGLTKIHKK